jgi:hypothetical protein
MLKTASNIRRRFCSSNVLRQTKHYVPHKLAARYEWLPSIEAKRKQAALISSQWNGDPGDAHLKRPGYLGGACYSPLGTNNKLNERKKL